MDLITAHRESNNRGQIEEFIRDRYAEVYGARIGRLAPQLVANINGNFEVSCAAGLRTAADGFACEVYFDEPVEQLIAARTRHAAPRNKLLEVTSLCSSSPSLSINFLRDIAVYGLEHGFEWSIFVATARLRRLLALLSFEPLTLAPASRDRMPNREAWGTYYDSDPVVMAVHKATVASMARDLAHGPKECAARTCPLFASFAALQSSSMSIGGRAA